MEQLTLTQKAELARAYPALALLADVVEDAALELGRELDTIERRRSPLRMVRGERRRRMIRALAR